MMYGDREDRPKITASFEVNVGGLTGSKTAKIKRVEMYDSLDEEETVYDVVIDHWCDTYRMRAEALEAEREEFIGLFQELYNSLGDQMHDVHKEKIKDLLEDYWNNKSEVL